MDAQTQWALVRKAITCGLSNCLVWKKGLEVRVLGDTQLGGLTPRAVHQDVIRVVQRDASAPTQVVEKRPQYLDFGWYYKVKLDYGFLPRPVFVEIILIDDDEDVPTAQVVSVHLDNP